MEIDPLNTKRRLGSRRGLGKMKVGFQDALLSDLSDGENDADTLRKDPQQPTATPPPPPPPPPPSIPHPQKPKPELLLLDDSDDEMDAFYDAFDVTSSNTLRRRPTTRNPTLRARTMKLPRPDSSDAQQPTVIPVQHTLRVRSTIRRTTLMIRETVRRDLMVTPTHLILPPSFSAGDTPDIGSLAVSPSVSLGIPNRGATLRRRTTRRAPPPPEKVEVLLDDSDADADDADFYDAEEWEDEFNNTSATAAENENGPTNIRRAKTKRRIKRVIQQTRVSRAFYEVLASRAGEAFSNVGNAAQVISTPLGFVAGPTIAGLVSVGGVAAVTAGQAAVKKFGRLETRKRTQASEKHIMSYSASSLIMTATKNMAGEELAEQTHVKALSLSVSAALDGGVAAGTVSLIASGLAAAALSNSDKDSNGSMLSNSYFKAASSAMGVLANAAPVLPKSMQGMVETLGNIGTAHEAARVGAGIEDSEDEEEEEEEEDEEDDDDEFEEGVEDHEGEKEVEDKGEK
ncbi:hypothetical protein BJ741DRAFT_715533 [Chytriomyces cf. hyalinus JEL632]|nr:hypothetical protein BJ741DRAFT_715533 [Chytriomyces cf. hyalinus JEL632]